MGSDDVDQQTQQQAMTAERLAEIAQRVDAATRGYWLVNAHLAVLRQNGESGPQDVADVRARSSADVELLAHAYADLTELLADNERQRGELNALAEKLDAETDYSAGRIESLAKRCAGQRHRAHVAEAELERLRAAALVAEREQAMAIVRAVAAGPHWAIDLYTLQQQARALLASAEAGEQAQGEV